MECPSTLFINLYLYAINKAIYRTMGRAGTAALRLVTDDLVKFLREMGLLSEKPSLEEVQKLLTKDLAIVDEMEIKETDSEVFIVLWGFAFSEFLRRAQEEKFEPVAYPFVEVIAKIYETNSGFRLAIRSFDIVGTDTIVVRCTKMRNRS